MIFTAMYVVLAVYFASVMVRLLLVLAPAVSICGGIGASYTIRYLTKSLRSMLVTQRPKPSRSNKKSFKPAPLEVVVIGILFISYLSTTFVFHATIAGGEAYSSPSVILSNRDRDGNRHIIDDYREAYYWMR